MAVTRIAAPSPSRVALQPALGEVAVTVRRVRLEMLGLAYALGRGEADGDGGVAAEDVQMGLVLGEVAVRRERDGVEDRCVVVGANERAHGAKEGAEVVVGSAKLVG